MELLDDIKELRVYFRKEYKDLRLNAQLWGTAWQYIDSETKNHLAESAHREGERDANEVDSVDSGGMLEQATTLARPETEALREAPKPPRTSSANSSPNSTMRDRYNGLGSDRTSVDHNTPATKRRRLCP